MIGQPKYTLAILTEQIRIGNRESLTYLFEKNFITVSGYLQKYGHDEVEIKCILAGALVEVWKEVRQSAGTFNIDEPYLLKKVDEERTKSKNLPTTMAVKAAKAFDLLPEDKKELLSMFFFEDLSVSQIAALIDLKENDVNYGIEKSFEDISAIIGISER